MPTALAPLKMLDLSRQLPGPFCSTLLADLGMDVLTIGQPNDPMGAGIPFLGRNKRSMTLNLKDPRGRAIFHRLATDADVVLEGARPGVVVRLGVDYETLSALNPRLIYCSLSGYGQDGPYRDRVGHDINYLGFAGVLEFVGPADAPPIVPGVQIADIGGGALMAAVGILAAVIARATTGRGQMVDIAMLDGAFSWNVYHMLLQQLAGGVPPKRGGEQLTGQSACYNVYETRDGRYVTVGAYEAHFWATLCRHFGREDYIPDQWAAGERRAEILAFFRAAFRQKTRDEWVAELASKEIVGPVNTIDDAFDDPQLRSRGMVLDVDTPAGPMRAPAVPVRLSDTPGGMRSTPVPYGTHTDAVLTTLGIDAGEIARLRADGVV